MGFDDTRTEYFGEAQEGFVGGLLQARPGEAPAAAPRPARCRRLTPKSGLGPPASW